MKNSQKLKQIVCSFLAILSSLFFSLSFRCSDVVTKTASCWKLNEISNGNIVLVAKGTTGRRKSVVDKLFSGFWTENFSSRSFQTAEFCLDEDDKAPLKVYTDFEGGVSSPFSIFGGMTYSNQSSLNRFEQLRLNILMYRDRAIELDKKGSDGCVYVPDFFADDLIKHSNGNFQNYGDLLNLESPVFLNVSYGTDSSRVWKIANIFRANGFSDHYLPSGLEVKYNDGKACKEIFSFLGPSLVTTDNEFLNSVNCGLVMATDSKVFSMREDLEKLKDLSGGEELDIRVFSKQGSGEYLESYTKFWEDFSQKKDRKGISWAYFALAICSFACFLALSVYLAKRKKSFFTPLFLMSTFLILFLLRKLVFGSSFAALCLLSFPCFMSLLVCLLIYCALILFNGKKYGHC